MPRARLVTAPSAAAPQDRIGPGRLVLVVGPSGAGKDTLIAAIREGLAGDDRYVFPQRVVTRPPSEAEDNRELDPAAFARAEAEGAFAATWTAHGLAYGLPAAMDAHLAQGRTVICNVSRTVVQDLRARYGDVIVVEVTAAPAILAARLAARGRAEDGDLAERLGRSDRVGDAGADLRIDNSGRLADAVQGFLAAVR